MSSPTPPVVAPHQSATDAGATRPSDGVHRWLLPGWLDSGAGHWQTLWESRHGCRRVVQDDWHWPRRGDWMARLDELIAAETGPVHLIAHSLGCHLTAAWAAHSTHRHRVVSALLVAPPDTERADMPPQLFNWRPCVTEPLPFRSLVVISKDDPFCAPERAAWMAQCWGSASFDIGARGHINAESGLGDWSQGWALSQGLCEDRGQSTPW